MDMPNIFKIFNLFLEKRIETYKTMSPVKLSKAYFYFLLYLSSKKRERIFMNKTNENKS